MAKRVLEQFQNKDAEEIRAHFQRLYDYFINDEERMQGYVYRAMKRTFSAETLSAMQFPYYNIVRRINNRLCTAYLEPADRYILVEKKVVPQAENQAPLVEMNAKQQKAQETYQMALADSNINQQSKSWHQLARMLDTIHVQVVWRDDHIEYDVLPSHLLAVVEQDNNYLQPKEVAFKRINGDGDLEYVYWSETEHAVYDEDWKVIPGLSEWNGKNKYDVLPIVPLRLRDTETYWGDGDTQLVDINEKINILLANTFYNAVMQSHGQMFGVNLNLEGKIKTGPDHPIMANRVSPGDVPPSLEFIHPEPAIDECMKLIDWMTRTAAMMRGLPAASVSTDVAAQSGAAKAIDNFELMEARQNDLEWLRPFEKKLFDVTRAVWNYHNSEKIPEDVQFGVDFEEVEVPMTPKEEIELKNWKLSVGLWTPVDDMIDEDEKIDKDKALAYVMENLETRNKLKDEFGLSSLKLITNEPTNGTDQSPV